MTLSVAGKLSSPGFRALVEQAAGCSVLSCYQCGKCGAGCPLQESLDFTPAQVVQLVRLEQEERVLSCKTIWLCASCETCTTRCPQEVDIARVMDAARSLAFLRKVKPAVPEVRSFYKATRANLRKFGRLYEAWLMASLKMRTGDFLRDMDLGQEMLKKRKLKLLPSFAGAWETRFLIRRANRIDSEKGAK